MTPQDLQCLHTQSCHPHLAQPFHLPVPKNFFWLCSSKSTCLNNLERQKEASILRVKYGAQTSHRQAMRRAMANQQTVQPQYVEQEDHRRSVSPAQEMPRVKILLQFLLLFLLQANYARKMIVCVYLGRMMTSTSGFWCLWRVSIISLAASSGVLGGGLASFHACRIFLYLQSSLLQQMRESMNKLTKTHRFNVIH